MVDGRTICGLVGYCVLMVDGRTICGLVGYCVLMVDGRTICGLVGRYNASISCGNEGCGPGGWRLVEMRTIILVVLSYGSQLPAISL